MPLRKIDRDTHALPTLLLGRSSSNGDECLDGFLLSVEKYLVTQSKLSVENTYARLRSGFPGYLLPLCACTLHF